MGSDSDGCGGVRAAACENLTGCESLRRGVSREGEQGK